jgi:hypothetical protein
MHVMTHHHLLASSTVQRRRNIEPISALLQFKPCGALLDAILLDLQLYMHRTLEL